MKPAWERKQAESELDYSRFCAYRDLGHRRSLAKAAGACGLSTARVKQLARIIHKAMGAGHLK